MSKDTAGQSEEQIKGVLNAHQERCVVCFDTEGIDNLEILSSAINAAIYRGHEVVLVTRGDEEELTSKIAQLKIDRTIKPLLQKVALKDGEKLEDNIKSTTKKEDIIVVKNANQTSLNEQPYKTITVTDSKEYQKQVQEQLVQTEALDGEKLETAKSDLESMRGLLAKELLNTIIADKGKTTGDSQTAIDTKNSMLYSNTKGINLKSTESNIDEAIASLRNVGNLEEPQKSARLKKATELEAFKTDFRTRLEKDTASIGSATSDTQPIYETPGVRNLVNEYIITKSSEVTLFKEDKGITSGMVPAEKKAITDKIKTDIHLPKQMEGFLGDGYNRFLEDRITPLITARQKEFFAKEGTYIYDPSKLTEQNIKEFGKAVSNDLAAAEIAHAAVNKVIDDLANDPKNKDLKLTPETRKQIVDSLMPRLAGLGREYLESHREAMIDNISTKLAEERTGNIWKTLTRQEKEKFAISDRSLKSIASGFKTSEKANKTLKDYGQKAAVTQAPATPTSSTVPAAPPLTVQPSAQVAAAPSKPNISTQKQSVQEELARAVEARKERIAQGTLKGTPTEAPTPATATTALTQPTPAVEKKAPPPPPPRSAAPAPTAAAPTQPTPPVASSVPPPPPKPTAQTGGDFMAELQAAQAKRKAGQETPRVTPPAAQTPAPAATVSDKPTPTVAKKAPPPPSKAPTPAPAPATSELKKTFEARKKRAEAATNTAAFQTAAGGLKHNAAVTVHTSEGQKPTTQTPPPPSLTRQNSTGRSH